LANVPATTAALTVEWELVSDGIIHKVYEVTIDNPLTATAVSTDATFSNLTAGNVKNAVLSKLTTENFQVSVNDYGWVEYTARDNLNKPITENRWEVIGSHLETRSRTYWQRLPFGNIMVGKGPTTYRLEFDAPFARTDDGWSSSGKWSLTNIIDPWWDESWGKRALLTVTGSHPENFQISFTIPYDADMKADFSDLRFVENDTYEDSYFIENVVPSTSADVWVRMLAQSSELYMYYGNAGASTTSSENDTFVIHDNFSGTGLEPSLWSVADGGNTAYSMSGGILTITSSSTPSWSWVYTPAQYEYPLWIEANITQVGYPRLGESKTQPTIVNPNGSYYFDAMGSTYDPYHRIIRTDDGHGVAQVAGDSNYGVAGVWRFRWASSTDEYGTDSVYSLSYANNDVAIGNYYIGFGQSDGAPMESEYDWLRVRKYASTEPSIAIGDEETPTPPQSWQQVERWSGTTQTPAYWNQLESWTGTATSPPSDWDQVERWSGTINGPALGSITLSPSTGFSTATISGDNFTDNTTITITWAGTAIATYPTTITADENGSFTALIAIPTSASGQYTITATDTDNISASATFTVSTSDLESLAAIAVGLAVIAIVLAAKRKRR
jgi:hypothetical protein